jgi:hypothetical protein
VRRQTLSADHDCAIVRVVIWRSLPDETGHVITRLHRARHGLGSLDKLDPLDLHCLIRRQSQSRGASELPINATAVAARSSKRMHGKKKTYTVSSSLGNDRTLVVSVYVCLGLLHSLASMRLTAYPFCEYPAVQPVQLNIVHGSFYSIQGFFFGIVRGKLWS